MASTTAAAAAAVTTTQWAVVTGAGSGLGRHMCAALAAHADRVGDESLRILAVGRRLTPLTETAELCNTTTQVTSRVHVCSADVSTQDGRAAIVAAVESGGGVVGGGDVASYVRYLIHNACVIDPITSLSSLTLQQFRQHNAINVEGPLFLTQALLPHMRRSAVALQQQAGDSSVEQQQRRTQARVYHIGSGAAHHAIGHWGAYCMSKSSLHMMYQQWNVDLAAEYEKTKADGGDGEKIATHPLFGSLSPGLIDTGMQQTIRKSNSPVAAAFTDKHAAGATQPAHEVANFAIRVLCESGNMTYIKDEWSYSKDGLTDEQLK